MKIGQNLKILREKFLSNTGQEKLAENLNQRLGNKKKPYSRQTISSWENDHSRPSLEVLVEMSKMAGVTVDWILTNEKPFDEAKEPRVNYAGEESDFKQLESSFSELENRLAIMGESLSELKERLDKGDTRIANVFALLNERQVGKKKS